MDPFVLCESGVSYERSFIEAWISSSGYRAETPAFVLMFHPLCKNKQIRNTAIQAPAPRAMNDILESR